MAYTRMMTGIRIVTDASGLVVRVGIDLAYIRCKRSVPLGRRMHHCIGGCLAVLQGLGRRKYSAQYRV